MFSRLGNSRGTTRQDNPEFRELAGLCIDIYRPVMLLDDDVVTDGKAQSSPFTGRLRREERVEHLFLHLGGYAGAVVADFDLDAVAEILCRGSKSWLVITPIYRSLSLCGCIKPI